MEPKEDENEKKEEGNEEVLYKIDFHLLPGF